MIAFMDEKAYRPMTIQELEAAFCLTDAKDFRDFVKLINALEDEGKIVRTRSNRYGLPEKMNLVRGKLQGHAKGFGFVMPFDETEQDVYVHASDMKGAMHGDTVLCRVHKSASGQRWEGEIVRVIDRANRRVVGTYAAGPHFGFVIPDDRRLNKDIFVPKEDSMNAKDGDKVVLEIRRFPEGRLSAEGVIVEVLGNKNDPGVDILSIIRKYGLPESFPEDVMAEAEAVPETIHEQELAGRRDLRNVRMVTIDGEDAKDLDDAVSVEQLPNGHVKLGVHIADVSYYVKEGSLLDKEAYNRGCSVYLVDRVIPMLPPRLSNGICSLNPQVDRLTLTCEMVIDAEGNIMDHEIFPSVIRTNERMTYTAVHRILEEQDPELMSRYKELTDDFFLMRDLALSLRAKRMNRGAIDFNFEESKIFVNTEGKPTAIKPRERSIAEQIVEEFMLAANETVAEHFHWLKLPFIYRVHEEPNAERLQQFLEFITHFGYVVKGTANKVHPRALQQLLENIEGTKEETIISRVMLRSMKQARYDAESLGHFGLAAEFYTHFTSPIRRYPDLIVHRMIREALIEGGKLTRERIDTLSQQMPEIARQSSERERNAVDAERETEELKKAEYMLDKIGEEFDGIISGVTSFGMFVELDNSVEGLVHISYLTDDYYYFHDRQFALIGERTGRIFRLGDEVRIRVINVDLDEHKVDFEVVEMKGRKRKTSEQRPKVIGLGKRAGGKHKEKKAKHSKGAVVVVSPKHKRKAVAPAAKRKRKR
jgi:ribonuclease R